MSNPIAHSESAPEFLAWAEEHQHEKRRHEADLAQISEHSAGDAKQDAMAQQQAWAREQEHVKRLHESAIAQIRHEPEEPPQRPDGLV